MVIVTVNGHRRALSIDPDTPLLWVLRDALGLKGSKYGCGVGICGICTVLADGRPLRACVVPVAEVAEQAITTIEGLAQPPEHPLLGAWIAEQVPQCGYCQPGQILTAAALLASNPDPDDSEIDAALSGVLCRCGTYPRIRRAVRRAAQTGRKAAPRAVPGHAVFVGTHAQAHTGVALNPWVRVASNDIVTVIIDRSEMGQGVVTSLAMLVAEELAVDLDQLQIEFAPADPAYYNAALNEQTTGGSTSVRAAWRPLRQAGAAARERLIQAAAETWGVERAECRAERGTVVHPPSGRRLGYGALAPRAANLPVPKKIILKQPDEFRLLGKPVPRLEIPDMVTGRAVYGMDVTVPGMLTATIVRSPDPGGRVVRYDAGQTLAVPGVRQVIEIDAGIAVVADDAWAALRGRGALEVTWDHGPLADLTSAEIRRRFQRAARRAGTVARTEGSVARAMKHGDSIIEAVYETPYLAHATLEPMNCTAHVRADGCELWVPTQAQGAAQKTAADSTGLPLEAVKVHTTFVGGGFGRRLQTDFVAEAVQVSRAVSAPVQVLWTRQDDLQHDFFRPANYTVLRAALDAQGNPLAWFQRVVGPGLALEGIDIPYAIPNIREEHVEQDPGVRTGPWRSVGASQNAFAIEGFIDELAQAAGKDPFEYRRALLGHAPQARAVLELAAEKAAWDAPPPPGRHRGIALYYSFRSWVATVAEVRVSNERGITVERVVCAIDCGMTINPDTVRAQLEGAAAFALSAALKEEITIADGQVQQNTFDDYPLLTLAEMPAVAVHIMPSQEPPRGVGEPGVPPVAPAVANAVFAATGQRLRRLPLRLDRGQ